MEELFVHINWTAVIIGAIAAYALGALWYSPKMFGAKWAKAVGISMDKKSMPPYPMIVQGIGTFLLAWVIGITERTGALYTAILVAITIAALIKANGLWSNKKIYAIKVEAGFILAMVLVMILAQAIF
jgi:hypothetical protein